MKISEKIKKAILDHPYDIVPYRDLVSYIVSSESEERENVKWLLDETAKMMRLAPINQVELFYTEWRRGLLIASRFDFDSFLQYVELDRDRDKKFYLPRRRYLKRIADHYQMVADGELDLLTISMPKRTGKAVTLDTLIPTPFGMKKMGDIKVGDYVMAKDGYETKVTDVFPQGKVPVYEVKFTDGATVKTCGNHLWKVKYHNPHKGGRDQAYFEQVISTKEMLDKGIRSVGKNAHNLFSVEYCEPAEFFYRDVELDPYVLGVLLGDGTLRDGTIMYTSFDDEVTEYIKGNLPEGDMVYCQDAKKGRYVIKSAKRRTDKGGHPLKSRTMEAIVKLGLFGKLSEEKFIPEDYLYNTSVMRFELLAGLLDTDGCADGRGIEYATTSPYLRDQVIFLVHSLGGRATYSERMGKYKKDGKIIETQVNYRVRICFPKGVAPFKIKRKADRCTQKREKLYRRIESITYCGEEEAQCICVDNEEHLFLITDHFIPTHNSQTGINFVNFLSGRNPDRSTLMEGTGDDLVKSFYNGCLEYLQLPTEYRFYDVFPEAKLVQTSADSKIINLHKRSRFPTIMCRSIDSRQVGLSEATNLLYMDDCVEGREEAKNRQRLDDKWEVISGDIMGRAIEGTPMVFCGTRYSIYDPIGRVQEFAKTQNWRWKALEIPALDENDESNYEFEKDGVKIFTSDYFKQQRDLLSSEQWESEFQQQPFEAKGLLFNKDELNYFYELPPDKDPDSIIAVADTAEKGSDSTAMPIAYLYGDDVYIVDVVFDNSAPEHTKPECANMLMKYKVVSATFESNNAGEYFARDVNELCLRNGFRTNIRTKRTISNKMTRMEMASDGIKKNFFFRHPSTVKRGSQYYEFMKEVTTITRTGKVAHDDAPDSLSLLENEIRNLNRGKVEILERLF